MNINISKYKQSKSQKKINLSENLSQKTELYSGTTETIYPPNFDLIEAEFEYLNGYDYEQIIKEKEEQWRDYLNYCDTYLKLKFMIHNSF